jgi:UDP-glucose 4-epimerase
LRILIVGGLGFLGSHCVRYFADQLGFDVRILTLFVPDYLQSWQNRYQIIKADITKPDTIRGVCEECDVVLHLAALDKPTAGRNPDQAVRVSGYGTRNLLEEALHSEVKRFIFFSTIHVYGMPKADRIHEQTPVAPLNDYSLAHYVGELYGLQYRALHGLETVTMRLANGFGAPVHPDVDCWSIVVHDFCRSAVENGKIVLQSQGTQKRDFIPITDMLQALRILVDTESSRIKYPVYNVGSGLSLPIRDLAQQVQAVCSREFNLDIPVEFAASLAPADFTSPFDLDIARIRELGFVPGGVEVMHREITRIIALLQNHA